MLNYLSRLIPYHLQAAQNSLRFLYRSPMTTSMTAIIIAIALTIPALFLICTNNITKLTTDWQDANHISLYLNADVSQADAQNVLERIRQTPSVRKAQLKTPEQGLEELKTRLDIKDVMQYLPHNPLPYLIEITPDANINTPESVETVAKILKTYPHVEQVHIDMLWLQKVHAMVRFVTYATYGLLILLGISVILIISHTLRLSVHKRRDEIHVLQLIGASNAYIIRPFVYSGIWYGLIGGILAIILIHLFILSIASSITYLKTVYHIQTLFIGLSISEAYMLVLIAVVLGFISAKCSINKQLRFICQEI